MRFKSIASVACVLSLLFSIFGVVPQARAASVEIGDPALKACINQDLGAGRAPDQEITEADIPKITYLFCSELQFTNLAGIEKLTSLYQLSGNYSTYQQPLRFTAPPGFTSFGASYSQLTQVPTIDNSDQLYALMLGGNKISSFPTQQYPNIGMIGLDGNQLESIDLAGLPNLQQLWLQNNKLTAIDINNHPKLMQVLLHNNQIAEMPDVVGVARLQELNLSNNKLTRLPSVAGVRIGTLSAAQNLITGPVDLSGVIGVKSIDLSRNQLTTVPNLTGLEQLSTLDLSGNKLTSLTGLAGLSKLRKLWLSGNQFSGQLTFDPSLTFSYLDLSWNQLSSLPSVGDPERIRHLELAKNNFAGPVDVTAFTNIEHLGLAGNQLTEVPNIGSLSSFGLDLRANHIRDFSSLSEVWYVLPEGQIITLPEVAIGVATSLTLKGKDAATAKFFPNNGGADIATYNEDAQTLTGIAGGDYVGIYGASNQQEPVMVSVAEGELKLCAAGQYNDSWYRHCKTGNTGWKVSQRITPVDLPGNVAIPDQKLLACVNEALATADAPRPPDQVITMNEAQTVKNLKCGKRGITDPTGLQSFPGLVELDLEHNLITQMPDLPQAKKLEHYRLGYNKLSQTPDLRFSEHLKVVSLTGNELTEAPKVLPTNDIGLLELHHNKLTSFSAEHFSNLWYLALDDNNISTPPDLSRLSKLTHHYFSHNPVTAELKLPQDAHFKRLDVAGNNLSAIPRLGDYCSLGGVDLSSNKLTKVPEVFASCAKDIFLDLRRNTIADFSSIPAGMTKVLTHDQRLSYSDIFLGADQTVSELKTSDGGAVTVHPPADSGAAYNAAEHQVSYAKPGNFVLRATKEGDPEPVGEVTNNRLDFCISNQSHDNYVLKDDPGCQPFTYDWVLSQTVLIPPVSMLEPADGSTTATDRPVFWGTGFPGADVVVKDGETVLCQTKVKADGTWWCRAETPMPDGQREVTITQQYGDGKPSTLTVTITVANNADPYPGATIDPAAPQILTPIVGAEFTDGKVKLTGSATADGVVTIKTGDTTVCQVEATNGAWACVADPDLLAGGHELVAAQEISETAYLSAPVKIMIIGEDVVTQIDRINGSTADQTAVKLVESGQYDKGGTVYVANDAAFTDALGAVPAATLLGAPILLVKPKALPESTRNALLELAPSKVYVQGGRAAVSVEVMDEIKRLLPQAVVDRNRGDSEIETAIATAGVFSEAETVFLANNAAFPDALAGGPVAGAKKSPILLVPPKDTLPSAVKAKLAELKTQKVVLLGGMRALPKGLEQELQALGMEVQRVKGDSSIGTALEVSKLLPKATEVYLSTMLAFPDALAAGPVVAKRNGIMLLTNSKCLEPKVKDYIDQLHPKWIHIIGGGAAMAKPAFENLTQCQ